MSIQVHGTGEAIRGNFNAAVDQAAGDKSSATKNQEIAQKGVDEWDRGYRGHGMQHLPGSVHNQLTFSSQHLAPSPPTA